MMDSLLTVRHNTTIDKLSPAKVHAALGSVPYAQPLPDEVKAFEESDASILIEGTVSFDDIDWGGAQDS